MTQRESAALQVFRLFALTHSEFRNVGCTISKLGKFSRVDTSMGAGESSQFRWSDGVGVPCVSVSLSIEAELIEKKNDRHAFSVDFSVVHSAERWRISIEIGWSCIVQGWDDYLDWSDTFADFDAAADAAPKMIEWGLQRYAELIADGYGTTIF